MFEYIKTKNIAYMSNNVMITIKQRLYWWIFLLSRNYSLVVMKERASKDAESKNSFKRNMNMIKINEFLLFN